MTKNLHASGRFAGQGSSARRARLQRGSIVVNTAIAISLIVIALVGTELGYLFYMKRELQKAADLAALAGAQQISSVGGCQAAKDASKTNANGTGPSDPNRNLPSMFALEDADIECGHWEPAEQTVDHFELTAVDQNAVRVTIQTGKSTLALFPFFDLDRTIQSKAVAANNPIASFSLGTGVASLKGGVINQLLSALLGTGNLLTLDVASYKGLAGAQIKLLDLISVIPNVGTVDQLLNTNISVGDFMVAMVKALGPDNAVAIAALNQIIDAKVKSVQINIGDILKVSTPSSEAAASANVNAFDLLMVAAQISNGKNFVNLGASLDLGPLATVTSKLVIVEPPAIAIGPAGKDSSNHWKTQAHSASIRLFLDASVLDTSKIPVIKGIANIQLLHIPLYIEAAPGDAWLSDIQCNNPRKNSIVTIGSRPGIANICIADDMESQMTNTSAPTKCSTPATITQASIPLLDLLGLGSLASVSATVPLNASTPASAAPDLKFIGGVDETQTTTSNAVGSVLSNTVSELTAGLKLKACLLFICLDQNSLSGLTDLLKDLNTAILIPLTSLLDLIIQPLLTLLGVQLGYSDIHLQSLICGESKLVY